MNLSSKQYDFSFLTDEIKDVNFELFASDNSLFINCIACWCQTVNDVTLNWSIIQSLISAHFRTSSKFEKWNIYLVIFCAEELPLQEKYAIQNDKYAVRKVVLDNLKSLPTSDEAKNIVNRELLGADLQLEYVEEIVVHSICPDIARLIRGAPLDMTSESKQKRLCMIDNITNFLSQNEN